MSRDVQIAFNCPHIIGEERVNLGTDRRTLYTSKPISGPSVVQVRANDDVIVSPFTGVVTTASLKSYRKEPYRVLLANRNLVIKAQGGIKTVQFPTGYLSAQQVVATIQQAAGTIVTSTNANGYVTITDKGDGGPASFVRLSGSATQPLGFDLQSGAKGQTVIPPWKLYSRNVVNPEDTVDSLGYYIGFDQVVKQGVYFTVTYPVFPYHCLRCLTTEVENDYRFDAQGKPLMVEGYNLLYQACLKVLLTDLKSNIYFPWYGTTLRGLIGSKVVGGSVAGMRQAVSTALTMLQNLQTAQAKYQRVTAEERLFSVDNISVTPVPDDPTSFLISVDVRSYSSQSVNISIVYTAPGTFALPGTNNLALGNYR